MSAKFPVYMPERSRPLFGLSIALSIITTLVLVVRFWSRSLLVKDRFKADDWTALAAWPLVVGTAICGALAMRHGFGTHFAGIVTSDPAAIPDILIITYVGELTWVFGIGIIRTSAILFYHRVFGCMDGFRKFVVAGVAANILFSTILGFVCIFQCSPVAGYWNKAIPSSCMSTLSIELGSGISSIILDLYTLLLPVPFIWRLEMRRSKKAFTILLFVLAYCVVICTIGRTVTVAKTGQDLNQDLTWYFPAVLYWVIIELSIAHICISLPSIFTLHRHISQSRFGSLFSNTKSTEGSTDGLNNTDNSSSEHIKREIVVSQIRTARTSDA